MADVICGEMKTAADMKKHLSSGTPAAAYLLFGEEAFIRELYFNRIRKMLGIDDINVVTFSGEPDDRAVEDELDGISLFGGLKLIEIRGSGIFEKAAVPGFFEKLGSEGTVVIFREEKAERRSKPFKEFLTKGIVFECARQEDASQLKAMLINDAKRAGRILAPEAAELMTGGLGCDIINLKNELEKLILTVPEGGRIEEKHVRQVCSLSVNVKIFDLTDAVSLKDTSRALKILYGLLENEEKDKVSFALYILTMLSRTWENLLTAKLMLSEGLRESDIASVTGQKPYPVKKQCEQCRRFKEDELREKIASIVELDKAIKSGNMDAILALELAVAG